MTPPSSAPPGSWGLRLAPRRAGGFLAPWPQASCFSSEQRHCRPREGHSAERPGGPRRGRALCGTAGTGSLRPWDHRRQRLRWGLALAEAACVAEAMLRHREEAGDGPAIVSRSPLRRAGGYFQLHPGFHFPVPVAACQHLGSGAGSHQCRAVPRGGSKQGEPFLWAGFTRFWFGGWFCGAPGAWEGTWRVRKGWALGGCSKSLLQPTGDGSGESSCPPGRLVRMRLWGAARVRASWPVVPPVSRCVEDRGAGEAFP